MAEPQFLLDVTDDDMEPDIKPEPQTPKALRDYFAGSAISGILANPDPSVQVGNMSADDMADMAFEVADAMILKREGKKRTFGLWPIEQEQDKEPLNG